MKTALTPSHSINYSTSYLWLEWNKQFSGGVLHNRSISQQIETPQSAVNSFQFFSWFKFPHRHINYHDQSKKEKYISWRAPSEESHTICFFWHLHHNPSKNYLSYFAVNSFARDMHFNNSTSPNSIPVLRNNTDFQLHLQLKNRTMSSITITILKYHKNVLRRFFPMSL